MTTRFQTGTVSVTSASTEVVGVGTKWLTALIEAGDKFTISGGRQYDISKVIDDTHLSLSLPFAEAAAATQAYAIERNFSTATPLKVAQMNVADALVSPQIVGQTAIPVILQSSGTIGNNGALSALTALPTTYTGAYLYFPENAIAAGVAAGLYYCVMSSTTAGTIYNNLYDPSLGVLPTIPTSPAAFVTTGPGAYTQTTGGVITLLGQNIVGGSMGNNGSFRLTGLTSQTNNANSKSIRASFGGASIMAAEMASNIGWVIDKSLHNRGVSDSQVFLNGNLASVVGGTGANNAGYASISTTAAQNITLGALISVATDYVCINFARIEVTFQ